MSIRIFTLASKMAWLATALFINLIEIFPFDNLHIRPSFFYGYEFFKAFAFLGFGFEIPLAFWRFDSLNRGLALSLLSAGGIEAVQMLVMGHRFNLLELLLKGVLIMSGFTFGILRRHDERIRFFGFQVRLVPVRNTSV